MRPGSNSITSMQVRQSKRCGISSDLRNSLRQLKDFHARFKPIFYKFQNSNSYLFLIFVMGFESSVCNSASDVVILDGNVSQLNRVPNTLTFFAMKLWNQFYLSGGSPSDNSLTTVVYRGPCSYAVIMTMRSKVV